VLALLARLLSALGVGGVATLVDLSTLTALVELVGLSPEQANLPSLLAGGAVQFLGSRSVVFKASGPLHQHLVGFVLVECVTLALNAVLFYLLVRMAPSYYPVLRLGSSFIVFVGFSFPAWHWVFKEEAEPE